MSNIGKTVSEKNVIKPEKFDCSHDHTTTLKWGEVSPVDIQTVPVGKSKFKISLDCLMRMAPLVRPTFGRMYLKTHTCFVPMADLYSHFHDCIGGTPYTLVDRSTGALVTSTSYDFPTISSQVLMALLTRECRYAVWEERSSSDVDNGKLGPSVNLATATALFPYIWGQTSYATASPITQGTTATWYKTDPSDPDYWAPNKGDFSSYQLVSNTGELLWSVKLHPARRRVKKLLDVLGMKPTFGRGYNYNVFPLLAWYRAYWDIYHLPQFDNWQDTWCNKIIEFYNKYGAFYIGSNTEDSELSNYWLHFFEDELTQCFYTDDRDYISAFLGSTQGTLPTYSMTNPVNDMSYLVEVDGSGTMSQHDAGTFGTNVRDTGVSASLVPNSIGNIDYLDIEMLKRAYLYSNRATQTGRQLKALLMQMGYGDWIKDAKSNFIGTKTIKLNVSEVTALTENSADNQPLGDKAGSSVTYGNSGKMYFNAPTAGYIITMAVVVPKTNNTLIQGVSDPILAHDKFTWYNPVFDGFGFQENSRDVVGHIDVNECYNRDVKGTQRFGYIPRYTGFKVRQNTLSGDFSLNSRIDDLAPYTLDKLILKDNFTAMPTGTAGDFDTNLQSVLDPSRYYPSASKEWRYPTKYQWLGNFNRIFYDSPLVGDIHLAEDYWDTMDHFYLNVFIDSSMRAPMKSVGSTWQTVDEEHNPNYICSINQ